MALLLDEGAAWRDTTLLSSMVKIRWESTATLVGWFTNYASEPVYRLPEAIFSTISFINVVSLHISGLHLLDNYHNVVLSHFVLWARGKNRPLTSSLNFTFNSIIYSWNFNQSVDKSTQTLKCWIDVHVHDTSVFDFISGLYIWDDYEILYWALLFLIPIIFHKTFDICKWNLAQLTSHVTQLVLLGSCDELVFPVSAPLSKMYCWLSNELYKSSHSVRILSCSVQ